MGVGVMGAMTLWDHGSDVCQLNAKGHLMMLSVGGGMMVHEHPFCCMIVHDHQLVVT